MARIAIVKHKNMGVNILKWISIYYKFHCFQEMMKSLKKKNSREIFDILKKH